MTRTEQAERALLVAQREDALDAKLHPCKLCGGKPRRINVGPDTSMHSGWSTIRCESCGQEQTLQADDMKHVNTQGCATGWDVVGRYCQAAEGEVYRRWQILNEPSKP